jgi:hypothetical protein
MGFEGLGERTLESFVSRFVARFATLRRRWAVDDEEGHGEEGGLRRLEIVRSLLVRLAYCCLISKEAVDAASVNGESGSLLAVEDGGEDVCAALRALAGSSLLAVV